MATKFIDLVCNHGSGISGIDCDHATWFGCHDEEVDALRIKATAEPSRYREVNGDDVSWGVIDGRQVVWDCADCQANIERMEAWLLQNEELVRKFFKRVGDERLEEARRLAALGGD